MTEQVLKPESNSGDNFFLETDLRYNFLIRLLLRRSRRYAVQNQQRQQELAKSKFENDRTVGFQSIIREPNGRGVEDLVEKLKKSPENSKIVILLSGIVYPFFQDFLQVHPFLECSGMKLLRLVNLLDGNRRKLSKTLNDVELGDNIPDYIFKTSKIIQREIFSDANCEVIVVRNAGKQDLFDIVEYGGENTVIVVGGHATIGSVSMTDGRVKNTLIPRPENPLKAFVHHGCASNNGFDIEEMGTRWARVVYGWRGGVTFSDQIDDPLVFRSGNNL